MENKQPRKSKSSQLLNSDRMKEQISEISVDSIISQISEMFNKGYPDIRINNKTLDEWQKYFDIVVPQIDTINLAREYLVLIQRRLDEASQIESFIRFNMRAVELEETTEMHNHKVEAISNKGSLYFAEVYSKMAAIEKSVTKKALELLFTFWSDIVKALKTKLSTVITITYSLNTELKILGTGITVE